MLKYQSIRNIFASSLVCLVCSDWIIGLVLFESCACPQVPGAGRVFCIRARTQYSFLFFGVSANIGSILLESRLSSGSWRRSCLSCSRPTPRFASLLCFRQDWTGPTRAALVLRLFLSRSRPILRLARLLFFTEIGSVLLESRLHSDSCHGPPNGGSEKGGPTNK